MFKVNSGAFFDGFLGDDYKERIKFECHYFDKDNYIKDLSCGNSFFLGIHQSIDQMTMSIENAVKLRDYLNDMIKIAEESGYFNKSNNMKNLSDYSVVELLEEVYNRQVELNDEKCETPIYRREGTI